MNIDNLKKMIQEKYISVQKHPEFDLWIYNYTPKAQFDRVWNEETMMCRGLILDKEYNIIARPFRKFFNWKEHTGEDSKLPPLPVEHFEITEKMDGSLFIVTLWKGKLITATRGSFVSDQAIKGTQILNKRLTDRKIIPHDFGFKIGYTWLFEVIYPQNRIVIDYGDIEDLILLSIIDNITGESIDSSLFSQDLFPIVKKFDGVKDIASLKSKTEDNKEGFVIHFTLSDVRVKIKFEEYVRLHRLITGVNKKTIWELLKNNQPFDELIERVPDEFLQWVKDSKKELEDNYQKIERQAMEDMLKVTVNMDFIFGDGAGKDKKRYQTELRSEFAKLAKTTKYPKILFSMLDNKDYSQIIWKMIRPVAEKPFKEQKEDVA